jgi:hypothetical protein
MVRVVAVSIMLMLPIMAATAQPVPPAKPPVNSPSTGLPMESVTVTGFKSREVINKFVKSFVTPTAINGKIARWESKVCPLTVGQPPALAISVTQHVKDIAAAVGAPVNPKSFCAPNIEIVFTTTPQDLLDNILEHDADYLGYAESTARRKELATVTRPVQAWYLTETKDLNGLAKIDTGERAAGGVHLSGGAGPSIDLPFAISTRSSGYRTGDGMRSAFNNIIIVVDFSKVKGHKIGALADYIAMLALTQLNSMDTCQDLPSIVNLMATNCDQMVDGITQTDLAYLRGLYQMDSDRSLLFQRNDIADNMKDTLNQGRIDGAPVMAETRCSAPVQPSTIDGATATLDQLNHSITEAKSFMVRSDAYQDCLGGEIDAQKSAATRQKLFDEAITDRNLTLVVANQKTKENVGSSINAAIASYKKAHPSP